jgi:hypothetical protein
MIRAYVNYPDPHISMHTDPGCGFVHAQHKPEQRYCRVNMGTISQELQNFENKKYSFAANPEHNDLRLEIDFHDPVFEQAVVEYICTLLGKHVSPFRGIKPGSHC